jgi:hypothetical protein
MRMRNTPASHLFAPFRTGVAALLLFCSMAGICDAQSVRAHDVVCKGGNGDFEAAFQTGVSVSVGPVRNGTLATRSCEADLRWNKQTLHIAAAASELDVDGFGVDLGMNLPLVMFQVKKLASDCCMSYQIYVLHKPPKLLRTLTGAEFFSAADTDLDGRVEIWADDAASVDGFEDLSRDQLAFPPAIVLRFVKGKLLDVSSEFLPYFDLEIAELQARLDAQKLRDFKNSDGRLPAPVPFTVEGLRRRDYLRGVKAQVLEIIWSYLYSGREQEAWRSLAEMWPSGDLDRIHAEILRSRTRGISAQLDGASTARPASPTQARIFDTINVPARAKPDVVPPEPIMLRRSPPLDLSEQSLAFSELMLDLVIDSAGKVRSAQPTGGAPWADAELKDAVRRWKFIPAFRQGRAVASRTGLAVSLKR